MKTSRAWTCLAAAFILAAGDAHCEDATPIPASALRRDAAVLRETYEALHPGLYRYNSPAEMAEHFAALDRDLDHDQSLADAFLAFTRFTATVRCGHSYPNFYNQPAAIRSAILTAGDHRLPFHFLWLDRRMVVTTSFATDAALPPGTVIEAIDGVPTDAILAKLMTLSRADGHNDAKRIDQLQVQGFDRIESFDVYFGLEYAHDAHAFELRVRSGESAPARTVRVRGLRYADRLAEMPGNDATKKANPLGWTVTYPGDRDAVLTMPTWVAYNVEWDWKGFLAQTFEALRDRGVTHLVIDLRGNEGGSSVGDEIVAHLVDRPLVARGDERRVRYRSVPAALRPNLDTWDRSFLDWGDGAKGPDAAGFYRLTRYDDSPEGSVIEPRAPRFTGKVDVLVDASNSSATFQFASTIKAEKLGTLIGQPTGGNRRGINGGAFFFLRLPESKIEIDVPLIATFPTEAVPDAGIEPDVRVDRTPVDVATGADPVMRRALGSP